AGVKPGMNVRHIPVFRYRVFELKCRLKKCQSSIPMKMKRCRVYPSVLSVRTRKNLIAVSPSVKLPGKDAVRRNSGGKKRAPRQERPLDQLLVSAGVSGLVVGQSPLPQHERISERSFTQRVITA